MQSLLTRGLEATTPLWADVRVGYHWVHQAAHILGNAPQLAATAVKRRLGGLLGAMTRHQTAAGTLHTSARIFPEGHPQLLARPLCLLYRT